jgi:hypothetical protein
LGTDAIKLVRGVLRRDLPAILVTGDTSNAIKELSLDERLRVMSKPIDAEELLFECSGTCSGTELPRRTLRAKRCSRALPQPSMRLNRWGHRCSERLQGCGPLVRKQCDRDNPLHAARQTHGSQAIIALRADQPILVAVEYENVPGELQVDDRLGEDHEIGVRSGARPEEHRALIQRLPLPERYASDTKILRNRLSAGAEGGALTLAMPKARKNRVQITRR